MNAPPDFREVLFAVLTSRDGFHLRNLPLPDALSLVKPWYDQGMKNFACSRVENRMSNSQQRAALSQK